MRNEFLTFLVISCLLTAGIGFFLWTPIWWAFVLLGPLLLIALYDVFQKENAILRNFPVLGHGRYIMEELRPKIYQYFVESDTNGRPVSRLHRSLVYDRAARKNDTNPFGTQLNVYDEGYEWLNHSIAALDAHTLDQDPRVIIGGRDCKQPYAASLLNISAMSFGSLSRNAIEALNGGAKLAGFAHNTGEGGISPYHWKPGGDLIFQFGTGYFGCRTQDGGFDSALFKDLVDDNRVKMIEIKLSQGAKPGHGGILPAIKNTKEIAKIRGIDAGRDVLSPPFHRAFQTPLQLIEFVQQVRELSGGKPIGIKLCIGWKSEFVAICKAMMQLDCYPDFIAVDGGEGGTGAAPLEFSNFVGMPYREGLAFVHDVLYGLGIRDRLKIIASGKIISAFDMFKAMALGADACYSARAMMLALGCIQALECNTNTCPTGVATQDPELVAGLVVPTKAQMVANFHQVTIKNFVELLAATGIDDHRSIDRSFISRRTSVNEIKTYAEIFPYVSKGCLLFEESIPDAFDKACAIADPNSFVPRFQEVS